MLMYYVYNIQQLVVLMSVRVVSCYLFKGEGSQFSIYVLRFFVFIVFISKSSNLVSSIGTMYSVYLLNYIRYKGTTYKIYIYALPDSCIK